MSEIYYSYLFYHQDECEKLQPIKRTKETNTFFNLALSYSE
jgi:hypothetical protein